MKLSIDEEKKIIKIEGDVKLGELFDLLNKRLPNDEWKEFQLDMDESFTKFIKNINVKTGFPQSYTYKYFLMP